MDQEICCSLPISQTTRVICCTKLAQGTISLLEKFSAVAPHLLPQDKKLVGSMLWHWDIHPGNLFIKNGQIASLVDWQGKFAGPICLQARPPRLLPNQDFRILLKEEVYDAASFLVYKYQTQTALQNPVLFSWYQTSHVETRINPTIWANDPWADDDIFPFRESLLNVER